MAFEDFWFNVRVGARIPTPMATVDGPRLDLEQLERTLRVERSWLTPKAVAGFRPEDFAFLPDAERQRLAELVQRFQNVVSPVRRGVPPTEQQVNEALPAFLGIVAVFEFDRYGDAEAFRIGRQVEQAIRDERPPWLVELRFNTGADWIGEPAVWVWAIMADPIFESDSFFQHTEAVREILAEAARAAASERWPFVSFRAESEQRAIEQEPLRL